MNDKWIPVSERLPEEGTLVLVLCRYERAPGKYLFAYERYDPRSTIWHADISIHAPPRGATAKDMQFLQIFCSTLTNQHGLTIVPRNLSRLFW